METYNNRYSGAINVTNVVADDYRVSGEGEMGAVGWRSRSM